MLKNLLPGLMLLVVDPFGKLGRGEDVRHFNNVALSHFQTIKLDFTIKSS